MSKHQEWKMIHLLYRYAKSKQGVDWPVLSESELINAGVHCEMDSIIPILESGLVQRSGEDYSLTRPAVEVIRRFTVASGPNDDIDLRIDYPEVFVIMPFSESWSDAVYSEIFEKGIKDANFEVKRGDSIVRDGNLNTNLWKSIMQAGVIIADVSVPNPNVYYEIGLANALGKPLFLFKQDKVTLPADFSGVHFHSYDLNNLEEGCVEVTRALKEWSEHEDHQPFGVKAVVDR